jgi:hypothetical protein
MSLPLLLPAFIVIPKAFYVVLNTSYVMLNTVKDLEVGSSHSLG